MAKRRVDQLQRAGVVWPILTKAARSPSHEFVTYSELATVLNTVPLAVRYALGPIQRHCINSGLPPLTALVVSKSTGRQGTGYVGKRGNGTIKEVRDFQWESIDNPFPDKSEEEIESIVRDLLRSPASSSKHYSWVLSRGNQQRVFRKTVLEAYDYRCCVCGASLEDVLDAAHIVEWKIAKPDLRVDPRNGLALCANHHRLFDRGRMIILKDYSIHCDLSGLRTVKVGSSIEVLKAFHCLKITVPKSKLLRPDPKLLAERGNATRK